MAPRSKVAEPPSSSGPPIGTVLGSLAGLALGIASSKFLPKTSGAQGKTEKDGTKEKELVVRPGMARQIASSGKPFRVFMGYDSHEDIVFQIAKFSMLRRSSIPLDICPLRRSELTARNVYRKTQDPKQSTEFTYLRFLIPYLSGYKGWALFADDDFLWLSDVSKLVDMCDDRYAVMVVKHKTMSTCNSKLAGCKQEPYPRKNWSSMILWNCGHPANACLDLDMITKEGGSYLHRFAWIKDDDLIGEVPFTWNFLIDWYDVSDVKGYPEVKADAVHYTDGGPYFPDYRTVDYSQEWLDELKEYEKTLKKPRVLCPYERFMTKPDSETLEGYANSGTKWSWDDNDATNEGHVWTEPYVLDSKVKA
ncbi:hexosyltransferase [Pseudoscourfieldia marina]